MLDLHVHLDGSMTVDTLRELALIDGLPRLSDHKLRSLSQVNEECTSLIDYLSKFDFTTTYLQTQRALFTATFNAYADAHKNGVTYMELRFAPALHTRKGLCLDEVIEAVLAGIDMAKRTYPIEGNAIIICMRNHTNEQNIEVVNVARNYLWKGVVAVDSAGDEVNYDLRSFKPVFSLANKHGIPIIIHAGEAAGADNVRIAIEDLGAYRIGHGVRAIQDEKIMDLIVSRNIPLEFCPTSNIQTRAVAGWDQYPIKQYLEWGVRVSIHTDNPGVSNTNIGHEYELVSRLPGIQDRHIDMLKANAEKSILK